MLQDQAAARGVTLPRQVAPEPKDLGQVLTDLHAKPGQLRDMLGGGAAQPQGQASGSSPITDILTSPMAKAVLAGIAAMVVKRVMARPSSNACRGPRRMQREVGGRNRYYLDHHNWLCGGGDREVLISRK